MPFLNRTIHHNPELVQAAVELHQRGEIPANSFVLDARTIRANAELIKAEAERLDLRVYFMTKHMGRNPLLSHAMVEDGRATTVAVELQEARSLFYNGIPVGHVGHLDQVAGSDIPFVVGELKPEVVSVFTVEKAQAISAAAVDAHVEQAVLLKVFDDGDLVPAGTAGGFALADLDDTVRRIDGLAGVRIAGVTTWPALRYDHSDRPVATPNMTTLVRAAERLEQLGIGVTQINAPGNTCLSSLPFLAEMGATHVEPGQAVTGHALLNLTERSPERPALIYLSEVSHFVDGQAWVLGGGFFIEDPDVPELRDFQRSALVGRDPEAILKRKIRFLGASDHPSAKSGRIDYYGVIEVDRSHAAVGDTVVFGFRTQAFATRAFIVPIDPRRSPPAVLGLYDAQGRKLDASRRW